MENKRELNNSSLNSSNRKPMISMFSDVTQDTGLTFSDASAIHEISSNEDTKLNIKEERRKSFKESNWRWVMLTLASALLMGNSFCYDNPGPIQRTLEVDLGVTQTQYSLFYSVYAYPNILLPILGGFFLDRVGVRAGIVFFTCFVLAGQGVFCIGGFMKSYYVMLIGRTIYGFGGEIMYVTQTYIVSKWFNGDSLSFAFGINISLGNLASTLNGNILPKFYNEQDTDHLGQALLIGFVLCICSLCIAFVINFIDKKADDYDGVEEKSASDEPFSLNDIRTLSYAFWLICGILFTQYQCIYPFQQVSAKILQNKYKISETTAGQLYVIPYYMTAVACPFLGLLIDKKGKRIYLLFLSSFFLILAHSATMLLPECQEACIIGALPIFILGIAYCLLASSIWSAVSDVVPLKHQGIAYGITSAIQNLGLAIGPTFGGYIHDHTEQYMQGFYYQSFYWLSQASIGCILVAMLQHENNRHYRGKLNSPAADIVALHLQMESLHKEDYATFDDNFDEK